MNSEINANNWPSAQPPSREDTVHSNFLPPKSFPEKSPMNGTSEKPPKTVTSGGAPPASSYNRYLPKPFTTSARPFERKFESPKFNHNLLPNDKPDMATKVSSVCTGVGTPNVVAGVYNVQVNSNSGMPTHSANVNSNELIGVP